MKENTLLKSTLLEFDLAKPMTGPHANTNTLNAWGWRPRTWPPIPALYLAKLKAVADLLVTLCE